MAGEDPKYASLFLLAKPSKEVCQTERVTFVSIKIITTIRAIRGRSLKHQKQVLVLGRSLSYLKCMYGCCHAPGLIQVMQALQSHNKTTCGRYDGDAPRQLWLWSAGLVETVSL